jgi:hypothetical protein
MTSMTFLLFEMIEKLYFLQICHSSLHFKSIYDGVTRRKQIPNAFSAFPEYPHLAMKTINSTETRDLFVVQGGRVTILQVIQTSLSLFKKYRSQL